MYVFLIVFKCVHKYTAYKIKKYPKHTKNTSHHDIIMTSISNNLLSCFNVIVTWCFAWVEFYF